MSKTHEHRYHGTEDAEMAHEPLSWETSCAIAAYLSPLLVIPIAVATPQFVSDSAANSITLSATVTTAIAHVLSFRLGGL